MENETDLKKGANDQDTKSLVLRITTYMAAYIGRTIENARLVDISASNNDIHTITIKIGGTYNSKHI